MNILLFLAVLIILIGVHEWGHFVTARIFGIRVDEFGIGYPPRAWLFGKWGDTEYTLNWLPFGGFVRIFGEELGSNVSKSDRAIALVTQTWWKQAIVFVAGITMNILLAWVLFSITFLQGAPVAIDETSVEANNAKVAITGVVPGSPADLADLQPGDIIVSLESDGTELSYPLPSEIRDFIKEYGGEPITMVYEREAEGKAFTTEVTPVHGVLDTTPGTPAIGIEMILLSQEPRDIKTSIVLGAKKTYAITIATAQGVYAFLTGAFTGTANFSEVAGPIGIAGMVGDASALGLQHLFEFVAIISINLAIINMLPVPALDGGRLLFVLIEAVTGRRIPTALSATLNTIGFTALIALMIFITYHDVVKIAF